MEILTLTLHDYKGKGVTGNMCVSPPQYIYYILLLNCYSNGGAYRGFQNIPISSWFNVFVLSYHRHFSETSEQEKLCIRK